MPKHVCLKCDNPLESGIPIVQMLIGPWYGAETPAFAVLSAEWHEKCFENEFHLNAQRRVYKCENCGRQIEFGDLVRFFVKGYETSIGYTVAEQRGHEIYTVNHAPACPTN